MSEQNGWIIKIGEKSFGVYSTAQLKQLVNNGKLIASSDVRRNDSKQWIKASEIPGLFDSGLRQKPNSPDPRTSQASPFPTFSPTVKPHSQTNVLPASVNPGQSRSPQGGGNAAKPKQTIKYRSSFAIPANKIEILSYLILGLAAFNFFGIIASNIERHVIRDTAKIITKNAIEEFRQNGRASSLSLNYPVETRLTLLVLGIPNYIRFGLLVSILGLLSVLWFQSRDNKSGAIPIGYVAAAIGCVLAGFVIPVLGGVLVLLKVFSSIFVSSVSIFCYQGFLIPIAMLLKHWQEKTGKDKSKGLVFISIGLIAAGAVFVIFGFRFAVRTASGYGMTGTLVLVFGAAVLAAGTAVLGWAMLSFSKQLRLSAKSSR